MAGFLHLINLAGFYSFMDSPLEVFQCIEKTLLARRNQGNP